MHSTCPLPIVTRNNDAPPSARLWLGALLLSLLWCGLALATDTPPIPLAELGQRADAQQAAPAPVLDADRATLAAPLQALRGEIDPAGLWVESTSASEGGGRFRLTPTTLSKGAAAVPLASGVVSVRDQAVILDRGPLTEVLTASGDGLRQDFVVAQPPAGDAPLTLTLALEGATAQDADAGVSLTLPDGRALVYHRLHITDAAGQVLDGTLAVADAHTLTIIVADAAARYPLAIDPTISDSDWRVLNSGSFVPGKAVYAMAYDTANSKLYVGGNFIAIGNVASANGIAQWDGSVWLGLGGGIGGLNNEVFALAVSGTDLYVGGSFTTATNTDNSTITVNRIAKWSGGAWSALNNGLNNVVRALAVSGTGLYVGGGFTTPTDSSTALNFITKWNGSTWSVLGSGLDGSVYALAVSGSNLYAGGQFTNAGSSPAKYIAKWSGTAWSALGSGASNGLNSDVYALAVSGTNLYVGGKFTTAGGSPAYGIAKWNGTTTWSALGSSSLSVSVGTLAVNALAVSGTDLYVAGKFDFAGPAVLYNIAKLDGSAWSGFGYSGLNNIAYALALGDNKLYVGGTFTTAGNKTSPYAAYVNLPSPTATTSAAGALTATSATLNGTVNPNGFEITGINFDYGTSNAYGSQVAATPPTLSSSAASTEVNGPISSLSCNTSYHFRVNATHAGGTVNGTDATFVTSACATGPTVTTSAASAVTGTGATLNGSVTDVGLNVSNIQFQYGTATGVYGTPVAASSTAITATPGTPQTITPTATLTGLTCNTTYYYRIKATDATQTNNGTELTFTTSACTTGPTVTTSAATAVTGTGATLNGSVTDVGQNVTGISFEYGLTPSYGATGTASVTGITATPGAPQTVNPTASITGLTCGGTTYHFRLKATDGSATNNGADQSFTTSSCNAAPVASNVQISGTASAGQTLTGSYTYSDADGDLESGSTFRWLSNSSNTTTGATTISGATGTTYAITPADRGKYLFYCVTPAAITGTSPGAEACSTGTQIPNNPISLTVTTTADPGTTGGCVSAPATACSLRDAIATASTTVADTIDFDISPAGETITLGSTMLFSTGSATKSVTIDGTGSNITVKGTMSTTAANFVVFNVTVGNTVVMKNFTIADSGAAPSKDGGGIRNAGTLTLQGMTLANHYSDFSDSGGLSNLGPGTATVIDSTFSNNQAASGGAIANSNATLTVINSTFSGNVANNTDWGGHGGAIYNGGGSVTLINNTVVGNRAVTTGGGGGIYNTSGQTMTLVNNLLANNVTGVTGSTVANQNCAVPLTDNGHNLDSGTTCAFTETSSLSSSTDALVGPLGYYGSNGGTAQTIPLLPGSAAIDAGDATVCANASTVNNLDQRGITRPQGTVCDIGAFESQGFTLTPVTGSTPQSATVSTAFANALGVTVASVSTKPAEPVDGGVITFTPPGSGASATLATPNPVTIDCPAPESAGFNVQEAPPVDSCTASLTATANATTGGYSVTAGARGVATNATFSLTNTNLPPPPINGVCGSANGQTFTSAPTTNLCSVGSPTEVTSNPGTFTWSCAGSNGGQDASCSATRASTATVTPATQTVSGAVGTAITNTTAYTPSGLTNPVTYAISPALPTGLSLNSANGVISGTPTASQATATFTVTATGATSGTATATATATVSITILATQATGTTPGGPVTARITGGTCLGYEAGSAQFTVPTPSGAAAGQTFPYGVFSFTALQCGTGGTVTITLTYSQPLPAETRYWKNIGESWVDWTSKVTITGNTVVLRITDGGEGDTNTKEGEISDPSGPAFTGGATSIPTLSEWGLILLALSLLAVVGWRQRQGYCQRG